MTHWRRRIVLALGLLTLCGTQLGCPKGGDQGNVSASDAIKAHLLPPSPQEQVAMATDQNDADKRRQGIILLSNNSWGLDDKYLKYFATLAGHDPDPLVRSAAVMALGKSQNATYLNEVVSALSDPSPVVRADAAQVLDSMTGQQAVQPLLKHALSDSAINVRAYCARALRHYPQGEVVKTLVQCLGQEDFGVRYQAHASLVEITHCDMGYEENAWAAIAAGRVPPPQPSPQKPWWDWMGVSSRSASGSRAASGGK